MLEPTIAKLVEIQTKLELQDTHVVWIGEHNFVIAHTDEERATIHLEECPLHQWLVEQGGPPLATGYYRETHNEEDHDVAWPAGWTHDFVDLCHELGLMTLRLRAELAKLEHNKE